MINPAYAKAYKEVLEIIKYFPKEEYDKISIDEIEFYKKHMDKDYVFKINPEIDLSEQNISSEAKAIIVNLYRDYFATEEQKVKIKEILLLNEKKEEQAKREKYNPDDIFKKSNNNTKIANIKTPENNTNIALTEYKESFFIKFKNFIFKILHIKR